MDNFLNRLNRNPYQPIDSASITRVDELGNGYDDWNNLIAPKFEQPQQTWGETALGVATAPARIATALAGSLSPYGADGWQVPPIVHEGVNALTAVGDAYNYGMSDDEINSRALGMAGFMMGGGGLAAKSPVSRAVTVRGYHGTRSEFDKFNGPSVFASENPNAASEWAMVANRDGDGPNVLPLDITSSNPYYAKSLFPDEAELSRIASADPDVVFYPPSTQHGTTFDKHPGRVFEARKPNTVRSATTGETLFSNASKEGAVPAVLAGQEFPPIRAYRGSMTPGAMFDGNNDGMIYASADPEVASTYAGVARLPNGTTGRMHQIGDYIVDGQQGAVSPVDMSFSNPLRLDAQGSKWGSVGMRGRSVDEIARSAREAGHDGLIVDNVSDSVGVYNRPSTTYVALQRGTVRSPLTGETLFSNASKESSIPAIASALEQKGARPEPSANALSSELSGTGFYPLSGGAETGTYLAFDDIPGNAPSPKQQQVRQMAAGHQGRMRSHPGQQAPEGLSSKMGGQELDSSGTPIGSFLDRSHYPRTGLNPIHEVHNWAKVRSMARKAINGEHVPGYLYDGLNGNGNLIAGTHRAAANELLDILGYGKRIKSANINDVLDEPEAYGLSARNADRLRQAAEDGDYRLIDEIWDQSRDTSLFSNSDSRPALLASALGQDDIPDWLLPFLPPQ